MENVSTIVSGVASVRASNPFLPLSLRSSFIPRLRSMRVQAASLDESHRISVHKQLQEQRQQREQSKLGRLAVLFAGSAGLLLAAGLASPKFAHAQEQQQQQASTVLASDLTPEQQQEMEACEQQINQKNLSAALETLSQLIEKNPSQPQFRYVRGNLYEFIGQLDKALEDFEEALKINPLLVQALGGQAIVLRQQGKDIDFIQKIAEDAAARAAEEQKTEDRIAFRMLVAQVLILKEELTRAFEVYEELLKDVPTDFRMHLSQGLLCCFLGNADKAEEHFKSFDEHCPADYLGRKEMEGVIQRAKSEAYNKAATNLWEKFGVGGDQQN